MLQTSDGETEILLGNKQLLGIFFVVVILLGVAFAGGYKVGQSSKKAGNSLTATEQTAAAASTAAETHSVAPEPGASSASESSPSPVSPPPAENEQPAPQTAAATKEVSTPLLGSKGAKSPRPQPQDTEAAGPSPTASGHDTFTPQPGQTFLQVAAVGRDEAEGISDVLRKKGFRAHAVPKPGNAKLYRVIIGPMRDPGDLNTTRNSLRNTGFREIIVQKY